jgi:neurofibromin 1
MTELAGVDLSTLLAQYKRAALTAVTVTLRSAIWGWIEACPAEFAQVAAGRRLEGGPDVLFDVCAGLAESSKKRAHVWPLMAALLVCCGDLVAKLALGEPSVRTSALQKKAQYLEGLRKALKTAKNADVAAACYVDLCRAASMVRADDNSGLRLLVQEIEFDVRVREPSFASVSRRANTVHAYRGRSWTRVSRHTTSTLASSLSRSSSFTASTLSSPSKASSPTVRLPRRP